MAWFTVQYRDKSGAKAEAEFEAADRAALFKVLSDRNLSAIQINPGRIDKKRAKSTARNRHRQSSLSLRPTAISIVVIGALVAVGVLLLFALYPRGGTENVAVERPNKKQPKHEVIGGDVQRKTESEKDTTKVTKDEPWVHPLMVGKDPYDWIVITNSNGKEKCVRLFHPGSNQKPPIFKHMSENELQEICLGEMGERVPDIPLNSRFRDDLTSALLEPVEINDEDSEEVVAIKQQVQAIKDELKSAVKRGEDPIELIREAMEERNRLAAYREDMVQILADKKKEGASQEELDELRAAANKMLNDKGVKLLRTADQIRENIRIKQLEKEQKGEL